MMTDTVEANKATVLAFLTTMSCNDPDAFTLAKGYGKLAGVRHHDTILATIASFKDLLPTGLRLDITTVTAAGERVVVEAEGNALTRLGTPYRNEYCFALTLAVGRIKRVHEYFCTIHADEVLWPLAEALGANAPE